MSISDHSRYINPYTDFGFKRLFGSEVNKDAQIANFTRKERSEYEESLKIYRDYQNTLDTAKEEGFELGRVQGLAQGIAEGRAEERIENARKMISAGFPKEIVLETLGLTAQDID